MRYSIMLQIVVGTTVLLVGAAAFFAWLQVRPVEADPSSSHPGRVISCLCNISADKLGRIPKRLVG
jgi:hypothetical protein